MILYHGTTMKNLEKIKKQGLKPRGKRKSNWETGIGKSRKDLVYLTNCYAPYYADGACKENDFPVIIKVDIDPKKIDLYPDEEFIFRTTDLCKADDVSNAIKLYEAIDPTDVEQFTNTKTGKPVSWEDSLEYMGTVTAKYIPLECLVGYYKPKSVMEFTIACDPSVSPLNYKICGAGYKQYLEGLEYAKLS